MKFKTTLKFEASPWNIFYHQNLAFFGSCFSNNIGLHLQRHKFQTLINPFGTIYNPISISKILNNVLDKKTYRLVDIFRHNELWSCFDFHSEINNTCSDKLLEKINLTLKNTYHYLQKTDVLLLTFGSAWAYSKEGTTVANCHKLPSKLFHKSLVSFEEISHQMLASIKKLKSLNPNIKIVISISPIRHIRDGIIENNRSKANLIIASHKIISSTENTFYFPAYELIIDDLRDYRYFKKDLVHPNELAVDYIIEHLENCFFDEKTLQQKRAIEKLLKSVEHKVLHAQTSTYKTFKTKTIRQIEELEKQGFNFSLERSKMT